MTTKVNSSVLSPILSGFTSITSSTFASTATTGTAPFTVTSTTPVTNLNIGGNAQTSTTASNLNGSWTQLPAGTVTNFFQAAAPTGWTQNNTYTNHMMRVVSGTGGGSGGTGSPILNNTVPSHTHNFTGNALGAHTHTDSGHLHNIGRVCGGSGGLQFSGGGGMADISPNTTTGYANISSVSAGTPSGTIDAGSSQTNWTPQYIDNILCAKS